MIRRVSLIGWPVSPGVKGVRTAWSLAQLTSALVSPSSVGSTSPKSTTPGEPGTPAAAAAASGSTLPSASAPQPGTVGHPAPRKQIKYRRKPPWGAQQLRDAWSEDAMSRFDSDSFSHRIDSENRYHPDAYMRKYIKWMFLSLFPLMGLVSLLSYFALMGKPLWKGDFQFVLNILRTLDTSPRSRLSMRRPSADDD